MDDKDTIIVVGATETDQYGNLWVTPGGGGDKIKIAKKRESLHPLFEQGKAVMLHWETYMNKPYVSDAKPVEGELPPPQPPPVAQEAMPKQEEIQQARTSQIADKDKNIARLNSVTNACALASSGMIPLGGIGLWAYILERYNLRKLDATQLDANIKVMLETYKPKED